MTSLIRESPALVWGAGELITVRLSPLLLPTGRTLNDFSAFTLTIRSDPGWPRSGVAVAEGRRADPRGDGWPVEVESAGVVTNGVPEFTFPAPTDAGERRYSVDVWGSVSGGAVQLVRACWLTIGARVAELPG